VPTAFPRVMKKPAKVSEQVLAQFHALPNGSPE
jgi:hypothetical protein